ncbi:2-amino-4-hydroxy-6-hydroxymethyldihydropteridine diphosphokinase [Neoroseomonas lacus]|uniref:2-amino-4-hydroxy-6-hydroxymethyldihydropteridine pyrophosphokinase n=1 Tax=Neoroseomonas lacus TaxID=287609 RepID=A0A917KQT7_9PROT|nr:2-amino-4-hydroxy-6-hydroxymethyldihydropteridine diphosphokinase [Neoroseomonas lacus]GGJ25030.1 2-amino-4-hydroxy-6-hydroxymethyldihydropteridine diphosphokinase [Neoroseomonas lacus]
MVAEMALVAIGANLPRLDGTPAIETCRWAVSELGRIPGMRVAGVSSWWASAPIPPDPGSPPYINGVARLEGEAAPEALLAALHAIEDAAGRVRPYVNAPRVLDLDLIDVGGRVLRGPGLVLPHPRAHLRAFVLQPLAEVAPGWVHPVLGQSVEALVAALEPQEIRRLP